MAEDYFPHIWCGWHTLVSAHYVQEVQTMKSTLISFVILVFFTFSLFAFAGKEKKNICGTAVPGGVAVLKLFPTTQHRPSVYFGGQRVMVVARGGSWVAVIGFSLKLKPGKYPVVVSGQGEKEYCRIKIVHKKYTTQYLRIKNRRLVNPNTKSIKRIKHEKNKSGNIFKTWRFVRHINLRFKVPVKGRMSSRFGVRRVINGKRRNPHSGIDIAAPRGTNIVAPADGIVVGVGYYFFSGKTVFVDHGQGLISMFAHMRSITVKKGQKLVRGEKIGTVGMTGRVTGPHLHWTISLNNSRVDPTFFLKSSP
ncbi:MAG: M23 family metallopeptidase [Patescibacteria group bacterium]|nr:MAG: M23 family metallopeptidase [Patescibacteria group bacterium]